MPAANSVLVWPSSAATSSSGRPIATGIRQAPSRRASGRLALRISPPSRPSSRGTHHDRVRLDADDVQPAGVARVPDHAVLAPEACRWRRPGRTMTSGHGRGRRRHGRGRVLRALPPGVREVGPPEHPPPAHFAGHDAYARRAHASDRQVHGLSDRHASVPGCGERLPARRERVRPMSTPCAPRAASPPVLPGAVPTRAAPTIRPCRSAQRPSAEEPSGASPPQPLRARLARCGRSPPDRAPSGSVRHQGACACQSPCPRARAARQAGTVRPDVPRLHVSP